MRYSTTRELAKVGAGAQPTPMFGSLIKLLWAKLEQSLAELAMDVLGPAADGGGWSRNLESSRMASIAGGTTEINRNVVAEQGLGLPR
jgi:alkylation response protein AidB-like acyl-CoA dehydrogenase